MNYRGIALRVKVDRFAYSEICQIGLKYAPITKTTPILSHSQSLLSLLECLHGKYVNVLLVEQHFTMARKSGEHLSLVRNSSEYETSDNNQRVNRNT